MKILWFTNTPSNAIEIITGNKNTGSGNWMESLENEIKKEKNIELGIGFHYHGIKELQEIKNNGVSYFLIPFGYNSKLAKLIRNWKIGLEGDYEKNQYLNVVESFRPDLIQIFGTENAFGDIINKLNIPVLIHLQGILNIIQYKYFGENTLSDYYFINGLKDIIKANTVSKNYKRFLKTLNREIRIVKNCKYFLGRTEFDKRFVNLVAPEAKYYHCEEILRRSFYENYKLESKLAKKIIFTTMTEAPYKGINTIFETIRILKTYRVGLEFEWRIAGLNYKSNTIKVLKRITGSIPNEIKLLGALNEHQLITSMVEADIFVSTSCIENSSNAVKEALLLGLPTIASNVGGIPSMIKHNINGILIQEGDAFSFAGAIIELFEDNSRAKKIANHARNEIMWSSNPVTVKNKLITIYNSILAKSN